MMKKDLNPRLQAAGAPMGEKKEEVDLGKSISRRDSSSSFKEMRIPRITMHTEREGSARGQSGVTRNNLWGRRGEFKRSVSAVFGMLDLRTRIHKEGTTHGPSGGKKARLLCRGR